MQISATVMRLVRPVAAAAAYIAISVDISWPSPNQHHPPKLISPISVDLIMARDVEEARHAQSITAC